MKKVFFLLICAILYIDTTAQNYYSLTNFNIGPSYASVGDPFDGVFESSSLLHVLYQQSKLVTLNLDSPNQFTIIDLITPPVTNAGIRTIGMVGNDLWLVFNFGWIAKKTNLGFVYFDLNQQFPGIILSKITDFNGDVALASNQGLIVFNGVSFTRYYSGNSAITNNIITSLHSNSDSLIFVTNGGELGLLKNNQVSIFTNLPNLVHLAIPGYYGEIYAVSRFNNNIFKILGNGQVNLIPGENNIYNPEATNFMAKREADSSIILGYTNPNIIRICTVRETQIFHGTMSNNVLNQTNTVIFGHNKLLFFHNYNVAQNSSGYYLDLDRFQQEAISKANIKKLDINQVGATYYNQGDVFSTHLLGKLGYQVPKNGPRSTNFTQSLWVGGKDQNNQLRVSAQTYRQAGTLGQNFSSGIIGNSSLTDTSAYLELNKIWEVSKQQILDFQAAFAAGNVSNGTYPIPKEIQDWPGNRPNSTEKLAPYMDVNNDNIYNPQDGDYPLIKGDKMLWWVYNDVGINRTMPLSTALGIEIRASAYAFACNNLSGADTVLNYTTFLNYEIQNRSNNTYTETYLSDFADVDLGDPNDDYSGCFIDKNTWFTYNSSNLDPGVAGYGFNPPVQAVTLLNGPIADLNDGIDNNRNGVIDEPNEDFGLSQFISFYNNGSVSGNPTSIVEVYNFMTNKWRNGTDILYGGRGFQDSAMSEVCVSSMPAKFMFPGSTDSIGYGVGGSPGSPITLYHWTENTICDTGSVANQAGDRRTLATFGPFTFAPNQTQNLELALIYSRGNNGALSSVNQLYNHDIDKIKSWYENQSFPSCGFPLSTQTFQPKPEINFFPNPNNTGLLNYQMKEAGKHTYQIFNITGKRIASGTLFESQGTLDLSNLANGMYFIQIVDGKTYKIVVNR